MTTETYIDYVRLIPGHAYPDDGPFPIGDVVGWDKYGKRISDDIRDEGYSLLGYDAGCYFEGRDKVYLGPDEYGVEPVFCCEGPAGTPWPVAWQENPELTGPAPAVRRWNLKVLPARKDK